MSNKKKSPSGLLKSLVKSIGKSVDSAIKFIVKHPISIKGKTEKGHEVSAKIGGRISKEQKDFLKSGKKFRISTQNGKNTLIEI